MIVGTGVGFGVGGFGVGGLGVGGFGVGGTAVGGFGVGAASVGGIGVGTGRGTVGGGGWVTDDVGDCEAAGVTFVGAPHVTVTVPNPPERRLDLM